MYFAAPRWRGTSPVVALRSASRIRGLGATQTVIDPASGAPVTIPVTTTEVDITPSGPAKFYDLTGGSPVFLGYGQTSFTDWLNQNSTAVLIGSGVVVALMLVGMRR